MDAARNQHVVAKNVRRLRAEQEITQDELAHRARMQAPAIRRAENGATDLRLSTLTRLAEALGVPPADLLHEG